MADATTKPDNKYVYGYRDVHVAFLTTAGDATAKPAYGEPMTIIGNIKLKLSDKAKTESEYADDKDYVDLSGPTSFEGNMDFYGELAKSVEEKMFGHKADANGNIAHTLDDKPVPFAMWYTSHGDQSASKVIFFHVQATNESDFTPETKNDKTTPSTFSVAIKATSECFAGTDYSYAKVREADDAASFKAMDTKVYDPTTKTPTA